ncbi:NADH-ubiquinone oxidoreductase-F iron-sulfur binding region domain-containing protein [Neoroseomonas marina]|uniref:NADH-ubiquinone oxidoreductase-F iron-sulfur binding region domain-containing protein n=1 Tax=Neoroseomonas marina TaxID=1232220 RepID=UPI001B7D5660|nr:NADH-ubiquinone oxidoreductase-F iron-sulfur binding region domain-containing protein [Neoroseomonas marina]
MATGQPSGARQRTPRAFPRGRSADDGARAAVRAALGDLPLRRDMLIEHLHALQGRHGALLPAHLVALAETLRLAPVEVFEVATFYAHFEVLADGEAAPRPAIHVCGGLPCAMRPRPALPAGARIVEAPCMGACDEAPACTARPRDIATPAPRPMPVLDALRAGRLTRDAILDALDVAGLRGMGGAGFPVARKWRAVLAQPGPRHLVVNADEGEPGTFKDRWCLEREPHRVLEGALIAAEAIDADAIWLYIRDEYPEARRILAEMIPALPARRPVHLRRGAGAYVCGDETALLESLEGKRGYPRHKPPFPGERGLFGRPTLIHNVETLWWLPELLATPDAPARFAAAGRNGHKGERLFSLSGRVKRPGVYCAPIGITARDLIEAQGGGMEEGHRFAAYLPGGASGGILPATMADLPLAFGVLEPLGCFVGSGAVVVLSDRDDLADAARNLLRFFRDESCGQCTPCRVGTQKAVHLLEAPRWDRSLLEDLAQAMADGSICGLGQAAMNPVRALLRHFPKEAAP